jgi:hypothetical protein
MHDGEKQMDDRIIRDGLTPTDDDMGVIDELVKSVSKKEADGYPKSKSV